MEELTREEIISVVIRLMDMHDRQGYNVKSGKIENYYDMIHQELYKMESLSEEYAFEFKEISRFVRKYILGRIDNTYLYFLLHRLNQSTIIFSNIIGLDTFWNLSAVINYALIIYKKCSTNLTELQVAKLIDNIQLVGARKIIPAQWNNILSSSNGHKAFLDVFDDVFTNAITQYSHKFIIELKDSDVLCRMVTVKDCDENRFIPRPVCTSQNRWNPPGVSFLYLSYGEEEHEYDHELTREERVCLLECRTQPNTYCSFCRFKPTRPGKILDLSYNDIDLSSLRKIIEDYENGLVNQIFTELCSDRYVVSHMKDKKFIKEKIKEKIDAQSDAEMVITESTAKQYLKLICSCIYSKVDGDDEEKEKAYKSFHILSNYLISKGITGVVYPCTRDEKLCGKNIVLFDVNDALPITGTVKKYYYR